VDLDADGVPEALTHDMSYAYELCSFAESPAPLVVLAWRDGSYRVANREFPRAYDAAIVGALQQALAGEPPASVGGSAGPPPVPGPPIEGWLPGACDVAHLVLNLLYAGHDEAAWRALAHVYAGDADLLTCRLWSIASSSPWYQPRRDPRCRGRAPDPSHPSVHTSRCGRPCPTINPILSTGGGPRRGAAEETT
jgi:hypothetical protein